MELKLGQNVQHAGLLGRVWSISLRDRACIVRYNHAAGSISGWVSFDDVFSMEIV